MPQGHPKHGSWLNIAECELSAMTQQCVKNRRFGTIELLTQETQAWAKKTNKAQRGVNWQFSIEKARHRVKLQERGKYELHQPFPLII